MSAREYKTTPLATPIDEATPTNYLLGSWIGLTIASADLRLQMRSVMMAAGLSWHGNSDWYLITYSIQLTSILHSGDLVPVMFCLNPIPVASGEKCKINSGHGEMV